MSKRTIADCPFCNGDIDGCCFCDHSGKIYIGDEYVFKNEDDLKPFQKEYVAESDLRTLYEKGAFGNLRGRSQSENE